MLASIVLNTQPRNKREQKLKVLPSEFQLKSLLITCLVVDNVLPDDIELYGSDADEEEKEAPPEIGRAHV